MKFNTMYRVLVVMMLAAGIAAPAALGQTAPIKIVMDNADFRYDRDTNYLEVYYSINKNGMTYEKNTEGTYQTSVYMLVMLEKGDSLYDAKQWRMQNTAEDTSSIDPAQSILDCVKLLVEPGTYTLTMKAKDLNSMENADSLSREITIPATEEGAFSISDIQLAVSVRRSSQSEDNPFYKNGLEVTPNPGRVFGPNNKYIFYYTELYNIKDRFGDKDYTVQYFVRNSEGDMVDEVEPENRSRPSNYNSSVEYGALKVGELTTGSYQFHLAVLDSSGNEAASREKKFYVYNPDKLPRETAAVSMDTDKLYYASEFSSMTEEDVEAEAERLVYLTTQEQKNAFASLTALEEKRKWLFSFWRSKDTTPATPLNEFRGEYMRRIAYANEQFREFTVDGWKTDRGRVYILYGEPDYIERHPTEPGLAPYQIWRYNELQNGVNFVFGDPEENDSYMLLHSDLQGEVYDANWRQRIRKGMGNF